MGLSAFAFLGSFLSIRLYYSYLVLIPKLVGIFLAVCLNLLALLVCHSSCPLPDDSICLSSQFRRFKFSHSNHQLLSWTCIMPTISSSSDRTLFQPSSFCSTSVSLFGKKTMEQNENSNHKEKNSSNQGSDSNFQGLDTYCMTVKKVELPTFNGEDPVE